MSIVIEDISKYYGEQLALDKLSFSISKGEIVGFLGPNGAGKSSLMKILTGAIIPSTGEAYVNGFSLDKERLKAQASVGYLSEHNALYPEMFVREYLRFIADVHKVAKSSIEPIIEKAGLTAEADKKIHQLSKGYRQRVGLAAALLHDPQVLILDEPTTGLDPNQLVEIRIQLYFRTNR